MSSCLLWNWFYIWQCNSHVNSWIFCLANSQFSQISTCSINVTVSKSCNRTFWLVISLSEFRKIWLDAKTVFCIDHVTVDNWLGLNLYIIGYFCVCKPTAGWILAHSIIICWLTLRWPWPSPRYRQTIAVECVVLATGIYFHSYWGPWWNGLQAVIFIKWRIYLLTYRTNFFVFNPKMCVLWIWILFFVVVMVIGHSLE